MIRPVIALTSLAGLGLAAGVYARTHRADDLVDRVQGVRLASRLPCDGSTNPQEELKLETTFSPGGWQRSFHLDVFESRYCKRLDLYFFCVMHGHDKWKHEWAQDSQGTVSYTHLDVYKRQRWEWLPTPAPGGPHLYMGAASAARLYTDLDCIVE